MQAQTKAQLHAKIQELEATLSNIAKAGTVSNGPLCDNFYAVDLPTELEPFATHIVEQFSHDYTTGEEIIVAVIDRSTGWETWPPNVDGFIFEASYDDYDGLMVTKIWLAVKA